MGKEEKEGVQGEFQRVPSGFLQHATHVQGKTESVREGSNQTEKSRAVFAARHPCIAYLRCAIGENIFAWREAIGRCRLRFVSGVLYVAIAGAEARMHASLASALRARRYPRPRR